MNNIIKLMITFYFLFLSIKSYSGIHIVRKNETLMSISFMYYHTHQCWDLLVKATPLLNGTDIIEVGDKINVPHLKNCLHPNALKLEKGPGKKERNHLKNKKYADFEDEIKKQSIIVKKNIKQIPLMPQKDQKKEDYFFSKLDEKIKKAKERERVLKLKQNAEVKKRENVSQVKKIKKYSIQLASFPSAREAHLYREKINEDYGDSIFIERVNLLKKGRWYRVKIGQFGGIKEAKIYIMEHKSFFSPYQYFISQNHKRLKMQIAAIKNKVALSPTKLKKKKRAVINNELKRERILEKLKEKSEQRFSALLREGH